LSPNPPWSCINCWSSIAGARVRPTCVPQIVLSPAIVLRPSTLLHFHSVLSKRKYRILFSPKRRHRPGPKGPNKDLIDAVVAMERRNPNWGCPRIAQQIALAFGVEIDKDVVRRVLKRSPPAGIGFGRSFLAYFSRPREG
jgi:hypothetical protein